MFYKQLYQSLRCNVDWKFIDGVLNTIVWFLFIGVNGLFQNFCENIKSQCIDVLRSKRGILSSFYSITLSQSHLRLYFLRPTEDNSVCDLFKRFYSLL